MASVEGPDSDEEIGNDTSTFMVEVFLDSEQKLVRLNVFRKAVGSYSHWSFHRDDLCYVKQIEFIIEIVIDRLFSYIYDILYCRPQREITETKHKINNLVLTLQSLKAPDNYDYGRVESNLQKLTYYTNQAFPVNHSPCNDLSYFTFSVASTIKSLIEVEIENINQFKEFHSKYIEFVSLLKENLQDMFIFGIVDHYIKGFDPRTAYRSVYSYIQDGVRAAKEDLNIVNPDLFTIRDVTQYPRYRTKAE